MDRVEIITGTSRLGIRTIPVSEKYDFIYIDGSHQASDVLEDAVLAFPLLKEGGIMIFDDYTWGAGMGYYEIPKPGIDAFISIYGDQLKVLEKNSQVVIAKLATRPQ
jgi:predicted O-methyltransferase YrrM